MLWEGGNQLASRGSTDRTTMAMVPDDAAGGRCELRSAIDNGSAGHSSLWERYVEREECRQLRDSHDFFIGSQKQKEQICWSSFREMGFASERKRTQLALR